MKLKIWGGTFVGIVLALAVGLLAQQPQDQYANAPAKNTVTLTGCVQRAQPEATGTSGMPRDLREARFVLTDVEKSEGMAPGVSGTAGTADAASKATKYRLDADDAKLSPHVGHKVEVTGTIVPPDLGVPAEQPAKSAKPPMLKVDTIKMIAETCK